MAGPPYADFVRLLTHNNPCLLGLSRHLSRPARSESRIAFIDIPHAVCSTPPLQPQLAKAKDGAGLTRAIPDDITRLLFVEDISSDLISEIGETLDIDPLFFAEYTITDFQNLESQPPPPPSLAILPSLISSRPYMHIHYQRVLDLGNINEFNNCSYALKTNGNIPRHVRRLAPLADRQLALARASCSIFFKNIGNSSIGLILVDRPSTYVFEALGTRQGRAYLAKVMYAGFEDFERSPSFTTFKNGDKKGKWNKASMLDSIMHYFCTHQPPGFNTSKGILGIAYYPVRIVLAEWNLYVHLTSRFSKHYEYSLRDVRSQLHDDDIVDLQRWRRRAKQSRYKLALLADYIDHRLGLEDDKEQWNMVRKDIDYLQRQLQDYGQSLEQMITVATSMVQLMDSRRSILEAVSVRRLTYIALIFIPLAWVSSLFSMSDGFLPGEKHFWIYFATSLPLLGLVVLLSAFPHERLLRIWESNWEKLRR